MKSMPYPKEFREDVIRVVRAQGPDRSLRQIAADFGIHVTTLREWIRRADSDEGARTEVSSDQDRELREANRRIRTLEQEVEVLRRAAAYLSQAHLPGK